MYINFNKSFFSNHTNTSWIKIIFGKKVIAIDFTVIAMPKCQAARIFSKGVLVIFVLLIALELEVFLHKSQQVYEF